MIMVVREACPEWGSQQFKRNGHIHNGKQNQPWRDCCRQFVVDATIREIGTEHCTLAERLLRENVALHGICRAIGVSIRWLMDFMAARRVLPFGAIQYFMCHYHLTEQHYVYNTT